MLIDLRDATLNQTYAFAQGAPAWSCRGER